LNISETAQDRAIGATEHQEDIIGSLSNGDISNDLHRPITRFSRSRHFWSKYLKNGASYRRYYRTV